MESKQQLEIEGPNQQNSYQQSIVQHKLVQQYNRPDISPAAPRHLIRLSGSSKNIQPYNTMDIPAIPQKQQSPCVQCSLPRIVIPPPKVDEMPVQTSIEYIPYDKIIVENQRVQKKQLIPKEVWVTQYETVKKVGKRPIQKTITDYYTVEHVTQYVEQAVQQPRIVMVEQQIIQSLVSFLPINRSIVHYPIDATQNSNKQEIKPKQFNNRIYQTRQPYSQNPKQNSPQRSIFYNPNVQSVVPNLYGSINMTTAIDFGGQKQDTLVIENMQTGQALSINGLQLTMDNFSGNKQQRFKIINHGDGYLIHHPNTKLCVQGPIKSKNNDQATAAVEHRNSNQCWYFDMVKDTIAKLRLVSAPQLLLSKGKNKRLYLKNDEDLESQKWNMVGLELLGN